MDNLEKLGSLGDLSAMLTPLLSDPDAMSSLRQAAEQMGLGGLLSDSANDQPKEESHQSEQPGDTTESGVMSADIISAAARLAPLLSAPKEDDTSRLLSALRPFLSQPRVRRLDEAERLLSLTRVLSILKESKLM